MGTVYDAVFIAVYNLCAGSDSKTNLYKILKDTGTPKITPIHYTLISFASIAELEVTRLTPSE